MKNLKIGERIVIKPKHISELTRAEIIDFKTLKSGKELIIVHTENGNKFPITVNEVKEVSNMGDLKTLMVRELEEAQIKGIEVNKVGGEMLMLKGNKIEISIILNTDIIKYGRYEKAHIIEKRYKNSLDEIIDVEKEYCFTVGGAIQEVLTTLINIAGMEDTPQAEELKQLKNDLNNILDTNIINNRAIARAEELEQLNLNNKIKLNADLIEIFELLELLKVDTDIKIKRAINSAIHQKADAFKKFIIRENYLTSNDRLEMLDAVIYDKGIYLKFLGTRNKLNVFVDNDFKVIRKPVKALELEKYFYNNLHIAINY